MTSICYDPEPTTNCYDGYEDICTIPGLYFDENYILNFEEGEWLYCSFGQYENLTQGMCCAEGQYYDPVFNVCQDAFECGFGTDLEGFCYLPSTNPLTGKPINYLKEKYFNQVGCISWEYQQSCCFNVSKFGGRGNYFCDINTLFN
jgi:hypothetical protein